MFKKSKIKIVALLMAILVLTLLGTIAVIYGVSYREMSQENRAMLELYAAEYLENGGLPEVNVEDNLYPEAYESDGVFQEADGEEQLSEDDGEEEWLAENAEGKQLSEAAEEDESSSEDILSDGESVSESEAADGVHVSRRFLIRIGDDGEEGRSRRRLDLSTFYSVVFDTDGSVLTVNNDDPSQLSDEVLTELAGAFLNSGKSYGVSHNMIYLISGEEYTLVSMMDNTLVGDSIYTLLRYTVIFGAIAIVVVLLLAIFLANRIIRPLEDNYDRQNRFISDAGHELKTPVSVISTNAELLQREIGENRWLENIRYENQRMTEIVRSLLDLLRAESAQPVMERVDLGRLVTAGTLPFEGKAFEQGIELSCEMEENLFIMGDSQQLEKLVSILIDNAFAHTKPSGRILVSLERMKTTVVLTVANEGDPIPPESIDKIFDRFYRVDSSRTLSDHEEMAHYGLGLSIAKAIATAHRAKITAECGNGVTRFSVVFPLKAK